MTGHTLQDHYTQILSTSTDNMEDAVRDEILLIVEKQMSSDSAIVDVNSKIAFHKDHVKSLEEKLYELQRDARNAHGILAALIKLRK